MPWFAVIFGYFIGSIPIAYIFNRLMTGEDIRKLGDNNVGAANAYRLLGPKIGIIIFILDLGKGVLAVLIAKIMNAPQVAVMATGFAVVIGHNWPVFLGFRGGRGESTAIGVLLVVITIPAAITLSLAILALAIRKNVILSSVIGFVPLSPLGWLMHYPAAILVYSIAIPVLVGITHFLRTRKQTVVE